MSDTSSNLVSIAKQVLASAQPANYAADHVMVPRELIGALQREVLRPTPDETTTERTNHAENLAKALSRYLNAHDTLSSVQSADEATGGSDAADSGFVDAANDAWHALRTALHEYRKHSPPKTAADETGAPHVSAARSALLCLESKPPLVEAAISWLRSGLKT